MKTHTVKSSEIGRDWYVVDAQGSVLGRLASEVAKILMGKHKPTYSPHLDLGDHVIVVNAEKIVLTGKKLDQKYHFRHTGYPGGGKITYYRKLLAEKPRQVIEMAVRGMLPKNKLGRRMRKKLKVYVGADHPHAAQQPKSLNLIDNE